MPVSIVTNAVQVQRYTDAVYAIAVGTTTMNQINSDITSVFGGSLDKALNFYYTASGLVATKVAADFTKNIGVVVGGTITAQHVTDMTAYVTALLRANPGNEGATLKALCNTFANATSDPVYGTAVAKFNADVDAALAYTGVSDIVAGTASTVATISLASTVDIKTGTAGNDFFDGSRAILGGVAFDTLNSSDNLDGGAGTDTLFVQATGAGTTTPASLKSIEIITVENISAGAYVLDLSNTADSLTKTLNLNNTTTAGGTITVQNSPTTFSTLAISNVNQALTVTSIAAAIAGTTDVIAISLNSATGAAGITNQGYETVNISSNGSVANTIGAYANTSATTLNIAGTQNLTMTSANVALATVNASTATGRVAFTTSAVSNIAITGGTAADTFTLGTTYTTSDTINGGAGADILSIDNATAILATTAQTNVTNMETLSISTANTTGAISLVNWGMTGLNLTTASAAALTASYAAGTNSLNLGSVAQTGGVTVNVAGVATTDVLNLAMATSATGNGAAHTTGFTSNGVETINLSTTGASASSYAGAFTMTNTASQESLIITGNQGMTFTGNITADVVNASGLTGTSALSMVGGGANSMTITGTANNDTLIGGTSADIITAGAGDDVVQNAVSGANSIAADVLTGGAGSDTFRLVGSAAATATNYNGVTFVSDFTVGSTAANTDVLSLDVTNASYGTSKLAQGATDVALTATAAGATTIQSVAQNAAATALTANTQLIKLTTGVAFTTDVQTTFNAAIGSATLTAAIAASDYFAMYYDTTNARAVLVNVDPGGANIVIGTADTVVLVGTIAMTAADYASFGANQFSLVDY